MWGALTVTATAGASTIRGGTGIDIITGGAGADIIDLSVGDGVADQVVLKAVTTAADGDTVYSFATTVDKIQIKNTSGAADAAATAVIDVAGIAGVGKTKIIADSTANLGADCVALGNLSATLNEGGYAFDTTTGKLYYDADGDFSAGVVCVGTFYSTALGGANTALGVVAAADFLFTT